MSDQCISKLEVVQLGQGSRSSAGERLLHTQDVTGSIPVATTTQGHIVADPYTDLTSATEFTRRHSYHGDCHATIGWGSHKGKPRCRGSSTPTGMQFSRTQQCTNSGKVFLEDGSCWCGIHGPEAVERRKAKSLEATRQYRSKIDRRIDDCRKALAYTRLVDALREIEGGHNDPRLLARETLEAVAKG